MGATIAPWAAALGLLISFTASAGTDHATTLGLQTFRDAQGLFQQGAVTTPFDTARFEGGARIQRKKRGDTPGADEEGAALAEADGATPTVPKAVALASVTPAPADAVPIEIAESSFALPGFSPRLDRAPGASPEDDGEAASDPQATAQNHYADLIDPAKMDREQRCLAEAVYFEARSEPEDGMAAVAQVVLNRAKSGLYPSSVCGVVYQNRHRYMACQFSFACEGKALRITDAGSWATATRIASAVIEGRTYNAEVGGATHYHANYVKPGWSRRLKRMDVIGRHIFYSLKPGQT